MAFCTARAMKKFALSLLSTHFGNSCWVASVTATFTTSLISCRLISDKKKPGCEIQNVSSKAFHFCGFELIAELNTTDRISCHLISCPTVTCGIWLWFLRKCILHIQQQTWFCLVCFPVKYSNFCFQFIVNNWLPRYLAVGFLQIGYLRIINNNNSKQKFLTWLSKGTGQDILKEV